MLDGAKINARFRPPTPDYHESWSLLSQDDWHPEQLREVYHKTISREASPLSNVHRDSYPSSPQLMPLQLSLEPNEIINENQVYQIPQLKEKDSISNKVKNWIKKKKQ